MTSISSTKPFDTAGFKQELKFYLPSMGLPPEMWSEMVCSSAAIGDMFIVFEPAQEEMLNANLRELKPLGLILVHNKENAFPMSYWLNEQRYEHGFMEEVISSHATTANSNKKALFCLRLSLKQEMTDELRSKLAKLAKDFGGEGKRKPDPKSDLFYSYLEVVNLASSITEDLPTIEEIADAFWDEAGLAVLKGSESKSKKASAATKPGAMKEAKDEQNSKVKADNGFDDDPKIEKKSKDLFDTEDKPIKPINDNPFKAELIAEDKSADRSPSTEDKSVFSNSNVASPFDSLSPRFGNDDLFSNTDPLADLFADTDKVEAVKANEDEHDSGPLQKHEDTTSPDSLQQSDEEAKHLQQSIETTATEHPDDTEKDGPSEADMLADLFSRTSKSENVSLAAPNDEKDTDDSSAKAPIEMGEASLNSKAEEPDIFQFSKSFEPEETVGSLVDPPSSMLEKMDSKVFQNPFKHEKAETNSLDVPVAKPENSKETQALEEKPDTAGEKIFDSKDDISPGSNDEMIIAPVEERISPPANEKMDSSSPTASDSKSALPDDMTALMKNRLNELGYKIRSGEDPSNTESDQLLQSKDDEEQALLLKIPAQEKSTVDFTGGARSERKSISLEATLRKLEEQKKAAFDKIEEFTTLHESACVESISGLFPEKAELDGNINFEVLKRRESVLEKIKIDSESARLKLKETAASYKLQLDAQLDSLRSFIESAKSDAGIYKQLNQMSMAAEAFASNYKSELVHLLDNNMGEMLSERTKKELNRIRTWNKNQIEEEKKYFELTLEQLKQYCANSESMLEDFVNSRCEELKRICDQQLEIFGVLEQRLNEAAALSDKSARQQFTRTLQKLLAENGIPFISEQQLSSREILNSLVQTFSQELESRALDSLKEIKITLENNKQRLALSGETVEEIRSLFDKEARAQLKEHLAILSEHLDQKSMELQEFFSAIESEDANSQKRLIKRIKHIRQIGMAIITTANEKEQLAVRKIMDTSTQQWNAKADLDKKQIKEELNQRINLYRSHRVARRQQLAEKLEQLTQLVESVATDYL